MTRISLRSWWDFTHECFCFGGEAVNVSGQATRRLVRSQVGNFTRGFAACKFPREPQGNEMAAPPPNITRSRIPLATQARPGSGLADRNRRDYGIEGKFWSGWQD